MAKLADSSLPKDICELPASLNEYLCEVVQFLSDYSWLYDFPLTHYFIQEVWRNIPPQWDDVLLKLSFEELQNIPSGLLKTEWPGTLQDFLQKAHRLSFPRAVDQSIAPIHLSQSASRKMNPKKIHEVQQMTGHVRNVCDQTACTEVVDMGAGLGYLSQVLHQYCGYKVLALESVNTRVHGAEVRLQNQDLSSTGVKARTFSLENTHESFLKFDEMITNNLSNTDTIPVPGTSSDYLTLGTKSSQKKLQENENCELHHGANYQDICTEESFDEIDPIINSCMDDGETRGDGVDVDHDNELVNVKYVCSSRHPGDPSETVHTTSHSLSKDSGKTYSECDCDANKDVQNSRTLNTRKTGGCPGNASVYPTNVQSVVTQNKISKSGHVCLMGLHCCGPLTPAMINLFIHSTQVAALVCVGCCYHSMNVTESGECSTFPMSKPLKTVLGEGKMKPPRWKISTYALRLAAQETKARWVAQTKADHDYHEKNVAYRALLQLYCHKDGINLDKKYRRLARSADYKDFATYLNALCTRTNLAGVENHMRQRLEELHKEFQPYIRTIEPFTMLQVMLQPVLETLIIVDRLLFLQEHGYTASATPIFDEALSPRNIAIIAKKPSHSASS